jgi:hypothetical protein
MSGLFQTVTEDAPSGIAETQAAVAAATSQAMADCTACQDSAATFMNAYGAAVVDGHGMVEGPGGVGGNPNL